MKKVACLLLRFEFFIVKIISSSQIIIDKKNNIGINEYLIYVISIVEEYIKSPLNIANIVIRLVLLSKKSLKVFFGLLFMSKLSGSY